MADEAGRIHILDPQLFAFTRQHQWTYLEKSKISSFLRAASQLGRKLDFNRAPERVFPDAHELIKHCGQREDRVFENRGKAHDADAGPAESVIDRVVVHRIRRTQIRPLVLSREGEQLRIENVDPASLVCHSSKVLGNGRVEDLRDVVVVDSDLFERSRSQEAAQGITY